MKEHNPDKVVAIGGNGTCDMLGKLLIKSEIAMGIVLLSSAKGLAKELSISQNFQTALKNHCEQKNEID